MADGTLVFNTKLDTKDAEKQLKTLQKDMEKNSKVVTDSETAKAPLVEQAEEYGVKLDEAKSKLEALKEEAKQVAEATKVGTSATPLESTEAFARQGSIASEIKQQQVEVDSLQKKWDSVNNQIDKYDNKINTANAQLETDKAKLGEINQQLVNTSSNTNMVGDAMQSASKRLDKFKSKLISMAKRVFVFSMITMALRAMRKELLSMISVNTEASTALAQLKGALRTLAYPILNVLIPVFTQLLNILTAVVTAMANFFSLLTGSSLSASKKGAEALKNEEDALDGVGGSASDAEKSMASFDTVNKLSTSSGGGGSSSSSADFSKEYSESEMSKILTIVNAIGSALLAWKISKAFGLSLQQSLLLFVAIFAIMQAIKDITSAWTNGLTSQGLNKILAEITVAVIAMYMAFGSVASAITSIVGGLALLALGFHDADKNGVNLQNTLAMISGILLTGLGISLLTGSWIPLLITGILGVLIAITNLTGNGGKLIEGLKKTFNGFLQFIKGIFSGDMTKAMDGLKTAFEGLKESANAVWDGIKTAFNDGVDWVSNTLSKAWDTAWNGLKSIFTNVFNGIIEALEKAINYIVDGLNSISFTVPDWVPGIGGKSFGFHIPKASLPRLATGAVIPPNSEFMAVLGDQKSGTNIETPLSTMVEAFTTALRANGNSREIVLKCDKYELGRAIVDVGGAETKRLGLSY